VPIKAEDYYENKSYESWREKVRFADLETEERAISSFLYQFMYVLILSLIMLFVNSIMSS